MLKNTDFQTPEWVCKLMIDLIIIKSIDDIPNTILEPTAGEGNLVKAINTRFPNSIIYTPRRFEDFNTKVDYIIANPPFTPMKYGYTILNKCFELSDNLIFLMPWLSIINSERRTKKYIENGLKTIIHLPRKAFSGSRVQTCILMFQKKYRGDIIFTHAKNPKG